MGTYGKLIGVGGGGGNFHARSSKKVFVISIFFEFILRKRGDHERFGILVKDLLK